MNFIVKEKLAQTEITISDKDLEKLIPELFPESTPNFHKFIYQRIVSSPNTPYNNGRLTITATSYGTRKIKKLPRWDASVPASLDRDQVGTKKLHNEWIMFNSKTEKSYAFTNLSALARALDIDYSWLYSRVAFVSSFKFKHFILTRSSQLEKDFYSDRLNEIL